MHTTEYAPPPGAERVWIHHNPDFTGEVWVHWSSPTELGDDGRPKGMVWEVAKGASLVDGYITDDQAIDQLGQPVPLWVITRAVGIATRRFLTTRLETFVGSL